MPSTVFKIENGVLALQLVDTAAANYSTSWQAPGGKTVDVVTIADYATATGIDFSCQVTSGALTASPNTTTDTTPATFCQAEQTTTNVGVTSYNLDVTILQDVATASGISAYLFENDTKEAYFLLGFDGVNPPKAIGRVRIVAGAIGGDARVTLTATLSLPVVRKPDIQFGNATTNRIVTGTPQVKATQLTGNVSGGSFTPTTANWPTTLAQLQGASPAITASPGTNWTTGMYTQLPGTGTATAGQVNWTGTAWAAGKHS